MGQWMSRDAALKCKTKAPTLNLIQSCFVFNELKPARWLKWGSWRTLFLFRSFRSTFRSIYGSYLNPTLVLVVPVDVTGFDFSYFDKYPTHNIGGILAVNYIIRYDYVQLYQPEEQVPFYKLDLRKHLDKFGINIPKYNGGKLQPNHDVDTNLSDIALALFRLHDMEFRDSYVTTMQQELVQLYNHLAIKAKFPQI